jgi:hypothetical protein
MTKLTSPSIPRFELFVGCTASHRLQGPRRGDQQSCAALNLLLL